jgi:hypothetical protein
MYEQEGRKFSTRYKEHTQVVTNNNSKAGYSMYILNTGHGNGGIT